MKKSEAVELRKKIELASSTMTDMNALTAVELFPMWKTATEYDVGVRVQYEGKLYKCVQAHTAQADWNPVDASALWAEVLAGQDGTAIGEWVQPGSTNPYMTGDKVTHNGKLYESEVDNNVWEPGVYGWVEI